MVTHLFGRLRKRWNEPEGYKAILRVGLPLIAGMCSHTIMHVTDRVFLSYHSVTSIAAVGPAGLIYLTALLALVGICSYVTVFIAQYIGSGVPGRVGKTVWHGIWLALAGGLILASLYWAAEPIFSYAGHDPDVQAEEVSYFQILILAGISPLIFSVFSGFYAGKGQTRPILIADLIAASINIVGDYLLIFGFWEIPAMGIAGAAIATVLGSVAGTLFLGVLLFSKQNEKQYKVRSGICLDFSFLGRILRYGFPSGVNMFSDMVASSWFLLEVGVFGKVALAACNIAFTLNSIVFVPVLGLNMAISSLVGQAMGRGDIKKAENLARNCLHLGLGYMIPVAIFMALGAEFLVSIFPTSELSPVETMAVQNTSVILLYFIAMYSLVDAISIVYFGVLKGAGDTLSILITLCCSAIIFLIIPIMTMNALGVASLYRYWIAFTLYIIAIAFLARFRYRQGKWKKIRIVETAPKIL